jgi:hypothetical protein
VLATTRTPFCHSSEVGLYNGAEFRAEVSAEGSDADEGDRSLYAVRPPDGADAAPVRYGAILRCRAVTRSVIKRRRGDDGVETTGNGDGTPREQRFRQTEAATPINTVRECHRRYS